MSSHQNKDLEERTDFEKARTENIAKLVKQFGQERLDYISRLYDSCFQLIGEKAKINPHLIPSFVYKETRANLINEFGKPNT